MKRITNHPYKALTGLRIVLGILIASFLLLFGLGNLIYPDVPESFIAQNTRICSMMIIAGLVMAYAVFRPYYGGLLLIACSVGMGFAFRGFFHNPLTPLVLLFGLFCFISALLSGKKPPEDTHQTV